MPNLDKTPEQIEAENDALILEQAKAFVRELRAAAQNAPYGKVIQRAEAAVMLQGREFLRQTLQTLVQEQNDLCEKKVKSETAAAEAPENISDTQITKP